MITTLNTLPVHSNQAEQLLGQLGKRAKYFKSPENPKSII